MGASLDAFAPWREIEHNGGPTAGPAPTHRDMIRGSPDPIEKDRSRMQVLRFADRIASRWKNGGGTTWEYAVHPAGAGLDDFIWRISRARVASHGAFSVFSGVDRTLTVIDGEAIDLLFPDRRIRLDQTTPPYGFPGDLAVECRVPHGPINDLNVMTRRGRWSHAITRHRLTAPTTLTLDGDVNFVLALDELAAETDGTTTTLGSGDALIIDGAATLAIDPPATGAGVVVATLRILRNPWM